MKYIRTKDGRIVDVEKDLGKYGKSKAIIICDFNGNFIDVEEQNMILKEADTIEELICDDDILYIYDLYPDAVLVVEGNIKPFGYPEAIKLKEWLDHYYKPKFDLFIKDSNGNYIKRAKMNDKGELELL